MNNIEQTLSEQNPHWEAIPYHPIVKRSHDAIAIRELALEEIQVITGIRRCGKSTLLHVLINHLIEKTPPKSILYINFDDPNYTEACKDASAMYHIVTTTEKLTTYPVDYLFLDEIQNVTGWEKYVKSVYDSKRFKKIVVTGSNADLLNSHYAILLSGRYVETHLYPFTYQEWLHHHKITEPLQLIQQKPKVLRLLDDMLIFGGFPRILFEKDADNRRKLLKSYYETVILKDCINNHNVRDTKTLINLAYYLVNTISSIYSYNSLSKAIESNENTVQQFIQILQDAYFLRELKQFSFSIKSQTRAKKKIYCIDNGLVNATTFKFSNNAGKLLENLVYSELRKKQYEEIYYFNEKNECDFIVYQQDVRLAIQVCYELNPANREREINGLVVAMEKFSIPSGIIITYDQEEVIQDKIQAIPFWKFFS